MCTTSPGGSVFHVVRPNALWLADLTYVAIWVRFVYVALVIDAYARRIVDWRASNSLRTVLVLDALKQALFERAVGPRDALVHHGDRGSPYLSIRYTERLAEAGIEQSVGSVSDSFDNALAESIIGLYKTEVARPRGPWRGLEAVAHSSRRLNRWTGSTIDASSRLSGTDRDGSESTFHYDHHSQGGSCYRFRRASEQARSSYGPQAGRCVRQTRCNGQHGRSERRDTPRTLTSSAAVA